jgi:hypothetical protein
MEVPMRAHRLRAYAQGELDYLCGLYAIINGLRHTFGPAHWFRGRDYLWLSQQLIRELDKAGHLQEVMTEGFKRKQVSRLLRVSQSIVAARWGCTFSVHRPFVDKPKAPLADIIETIRKHQQQQSRSVVIRVSGHWSVVRQTTDTRFDMLDSFEYHRLRFADIRVGKPRTSADDEDWYWISPATVFLLSEDAERH